VDVLVLAAGDLVVDHEVPALHQYVAQVRVRGLERPARGARYAASDVDVSSRSQRPAPSTFHRPVEIPFQAAVEYRALKRKPR
jgi:hypothetical protein